MVHETLYEEPLPGKRPTEELNQRAITAFKNNADLEDCLDSSASPEEAIQVGRQTFGAEERNGMTYVSGKEKGLKVLDGTLREQEQKWWEKQLEKLDKRTISFNKKRFKKQSK